MDLIFYGLKLYGLVSVTFFLIGMAVNLSTKKQYRQTQQEIWIEMIRIWGSMTAIFLIVLGLAWFLFKVI